MFLGIVAFSIMIVGFTQILSFNHQFEYGFTYATIECLVVIIILFEIDEIKQYISVYRQRKEYAKVTTNTQLAQAQGDSEKYRIKFAGDYYKLNTLIAARNFPYPLTYNHHWVYCMDLIAIQTKIIDDKIAKLNCY